MVLRSRASWAAGFLLLLAGACSTPLSAQSPIWVADLSSNDGWYVDDESKPWATDATGVEHDATGGLRFLIDSSRGRGKAVIGHEYPDGILDGAKATHFRVILDTDVPLLVGIYSNDRNGRFYGLPSAPVAAGKGVEALVSVDDVPQGMRGDLIRAKILISGYNADSNVVVRSLELVSRPVIKEQKTRQLLEVAPGLKNLALKSITQATSEESPENNAGAAVDGDLLTRWASAASDAQSITVDLGSAQPVNRAVLYWETAHAADYELLGSVDGENWSSLAKVTDSLGGNESVGFAGTKARFIRMSGARRGTSYGYSLYEFQVCNDPDAKPGVIRSGGTVVPIRPIVGFEPGKGLPSVAKALAIPAVSVMTKEVRKRLPLELVANVQASYANPYDPTDVSVTADFTSPDGKVVTVPAFFYRPFERKIVENQEQLVSSGDGEWRVRFTPQVLGAWSCVVRAKDRTGSTESAPVLLSVADSKAGGFVHVVEPEKRYFADEAGDLYFPIGLNIAWFSEGGGRGNLQTLEYDRCLEDLAANGGNFVRIWMCSWAFAPEWSDTGLGNYDVRQPRLWRLDHILNRCDELGIKVMLCFANHGAFSTTTNAEWNGNPYNAANGGPCNSPEDFLTNAEARRFWKQRVRYIAARYAAHPSIFAWEWFNEMEYANGFISPEFAPWVAEMTATIREYDPYKHPVTTSSSALGGPLIWDPPSIEFTQAHSYESGNWTVTIEQAAKKTRNGWKKPFMFGEFGMSAQGNGLLDEGWYLHNGNWSSFFAGSGGGAMTWWWDSLVFASEPSLAHRYRGFAKFLAGENPHRGDIALRREAVKAPDGTRLEARFLDADGTTYLWLRRPDATEVGAHLLAKQGSWWQTVSGVSVPLTDIADATSIEWWNTETGEIVGRESFGTSPKAVAVPPFEADIAAKIRRNDAP